MAIKTSDIAKFKDLCKKSPLFLHPDNTASVGYTQNNDILDKVQYFVTTLFCNKEFSTKFESNRYIHTIETNVILSLPASSGNCNYIQLSIEMFSSNSTKLAYISFSIIYLYGNQPFIDLLPIND